MNVAHKLYTWACYADEIRIGVDWARVHQMAAVEAGAIVRFQVERMGRLAAINLKNDMLSMSPSQPGMLEAQTDDGQPMLVRLIIMRRMTPDDVPVDAEL